MISYILIAIALLLLILLITGSFRRKTSSGENRDNDYIDGLRSIISGDIDQAIIKLKATVKTNTDNVMAYLELGRLFREHGRPVRASKLHRQLLVRGDLDADIIQQLLYQLVLDYLAAGALGKAQEMAERLVERKKKDKKYSDLLLQVYEIKGEWDKALMYVQSLNRWQKKHRDLPRLAYYKVQSGLAKEKQGAFREGRIRFREAVKLDKTCAQAYLYWSKSYLREDRLKDAVKIWNDFCERVPQWAHLAFEELEETLFKLNRYDEIEGIYQKVWNKRPTAQDAVLRLAVYYQKLGKINEALDILHQAIETYPDSARVRYALITTYKDNGDSANVISEAQKFLSELAETTTLYTCTFCSQSSETPPWRCEHCGKWNNFSNQDNR
ncbi:tetratricopeptide repeat protein [bacterium]|nr:tetratricopeptide repeat protein [bacterium]